MSNLDNPSFRVALAKEIMRRIDEYCVKTYDEGHRSHLGASLIGDPCQRKLWYSFRWVYHKQFSGRMYRLFNRGHREEARFLGFLRGIGLTITDVLENGKQIRCIAVNGHYGGSLDGIAHEFPPDLGINEPLLCEFKTKKDGSDFNDLKKKGVKIANWQHYCQMSTYGMFHQIRYAIYMTVNKNTDDIHCEIVQLDWALGAAKLETADYIINSRQAPNRCAANRAYSACKMCDYEPICWDNIQPQKNCRSCWKAKPVQNSEWFCEQFNCIIPKKVIPNGCDNWEPVK